MKCFSEKLGFDELKPIANELLRETIEMLNSLDIKYFLISGTLLGYCRHNDYIPWDDDIDLMVDRESFFLNKHKIIKSYGENLTFVMKDDYLCKVCLKNKGIEKTKSKLNKYVMQKDRKMFFPFIDLFFYTVVDDDNIEFFCKKWKQEEFFPLQNVIFNDIENIYIPKNPYYFLYLNYGKNCMTIAVSSNWDHKNEIAIEVKKTIEVSRLRK